MPNLPPEPYSATDSLLSIFQIDLENYIKVKFAFMYHMHTPGSELELMPYWEYEMMVETLQDVLKKKQESEKKSYKDSDAYNVNPGQQANSMMKSASASMPKAPSMPSPSSFKMPKM